MWLCALGFGFSVCWLWTFFLNGPLLAAVSANWSEDVEIIFLVFLLFHSLSFLFTALGLAHVPSLVKNRRLLIIASLLMTGGTLAVSFIPGDPTFSERWPFILIAAALAGLGSAPIVAAWGEAFSNRPLKEVGLGYACAIIVSTILFFGANALDTTPAVILAASFPLISLLLYLSRKYPEPQAIPAEVGWRCPLPIKLIVLLALFYLTSGFMHKLIYSVENLPLQETYWLTNIVYCLVCLLAGASTYLRPDIDLRLLYRPALPFLGAGFMLFPFLGDIFELLPFALLQTGFALFDVYTWLLFIYLGSLYHASGYMVSWGMFFLTLSSFCGEVMSNSLATMVSLTLRQLDVLAIGAALIMFFATLVFQDERETFAGWKPNPLHDIPSASLEALPTEAIETAAALPVTNEAVHDLAPEQVSPVLSVEHSFCAMNSLTARECEVALLLLKGRNNPFIRESLNISDNTLKSHLRNIYRKLDITNRQELFSLFDSFRKG